MRPVHQHLRLDDRHQPRLLRERRHPGQRVRVHIQAVVRRQPPAGRGAGRGVDRDHRPPLREPRPQLRVLRQPLPQTVQTLRHLLPRRARQILRSLVDLHPRNHPRRGQHLHQRPPVRRLLPQRLLEQNYPGDVVPDPLRREQQLPPVAPIRLRRIHPDPVEAALDRRRRLIGGQNALARCHQRAGRVVEFCGHDSAASLSCLTTDSTTSALPTISGVRWCNCSGSRSRMRRVPSLPAPPACSAT